MKHCTRDRFAHCILSSLLLLSFLTPTLLLPGQQLPNTGFVPLDTKRQNRCSVTPERAEAISRMLQDNMVSLTKRGLLLPPSANKEQQTLFTWPTRQAAGFNDPGYYTITAFADHNPVFPNQLLDYNCGVRSYDATGGNHLGTDIASFPFGWEKMTNNVVEIIASAPGTIIGKRDDEPDQSCLPLLYRFYNRHKKQ